MFVDDDLNLLMGLRRSLYPMRDQWEMEFVQGGQDALKKLDQPFDVVVSDMRMPGMTGLELLNIVQERFPQSVRILLSGQSDRESILASAAQAHQYLSKPFDAKQLISLLSQTIALGDLLSNPSIKAFVSRLNSIPSLPSLYFEVMDALRGSDPSPAAIARLIASDMGMTAKILQVANSVTYAARCEVTQPEQAVLRIGLDTVQSLVLSVSIFSALSPRLQADYSMEALWQHSNSTGAFCGAIARAEGIGRGPLGAYVSAGLLHDVGKLIIAHCDRNLPCAISKVAADGGISTLKAEMEILGCTHAEVGAYLLGIWGLPFPIVEATAWHHHPSDSAATDFSPLAAVHVANVLAGREHKQSTFADEEIENDFIERIGCEARIRDWTEVCEKLGNGGQNND